MFHSRKLSVLSLFLAMILLVCLLPMASLSGAAPPAQGESYTVQKDDSLWLVAEKYLGNGVDYWAIVDATNARNVQDPAFAKIANPDLIQPGWKLWVPSTEEAEALLMIRIPRPKPTATIEVPVITVLDPSGTPIPNRWPCVVQATQFDASDFRDGEDLQILQMALQPISDKYQSGLFKIPNPEVWARIDSWFGPTGTLVIEGPESWGTQIHIVGAEERGQLPPSTPYVEIFILRADGTYGPVGQLPPSTPYPPISGDLTRLLDDILSSDFKLQRPVSKESIGWMAYPLGTLSAAQRTSDPLEFNKLLQESLLASFSACSILPPGSSERQVVELEVIPDLLGLAALRKVPIEPEMMAGRAPSP